MAGRPPKPTSQKVLQGTWRADRALENEPQPKRGLGKMPAGLPVRAKTEWKRCQDWLGGQVIKDCDRAVVEVYCRAVAELPEFEAALDEDGRYQQSETSGLLSAHPALSAQRQLRELILKCSTMLGLNPSARSRISVTPESKTPSAYEKFKNDG